MKQTNTIQTSYSEEELKGRALLVELLPKIYNRDKYKIYYHLSDLAEGDVYDAFVSIYNKETGSHLANHIVEVKIRYENHDKDGYMYEQSKDKSLKSVLKRNYNTADIIYINATSTGTYIWNVSKLESQNKLKWGYRACNKSTVEYYNSSIKDTKEKKVAYLQIADAIKHYPTVTYQYLEIKKEAERKQIEEIVAEKQRQKCLYQWLLTPSQLKGEIKKNDEL